MIEFQCIFNKQQRNAQNSEVMKNTLQTISKLRGSERINPNSITLHIWAY